MEIKTAENSGLQIKIQNQMNWEDYEKQLRELGYKDDAVDIIKSAFAYAAKIHADEKRASGDPYITHPIAVSLNVAKIKMDAPTIAAALLHDVVENKGIKPEELKKQFGEEIAFLVDALTKAEKVQYRGVERAVESLRKMFLALAQDIRVVIIKLMDRLHNMETLRYLPPEKQKRIAMETLELYAPLADRLGIWEVKARLEDLAFPYVYPEEYKWLMSQIKNRREEDEKYMEKLKPTVEAELKKENVSGARIICRAKHFYSIWKKLIKHEMNFDRILDLVSMRIILQNSEDCYRALGIIHKLWKPMPGRIKDYIARTKPNGYRSIHTTVFGPEEKKIDIQIRTVEMDEEAEHGIAAHWFYEAQGKKPVTKKLDDKGFFWVGQLQEWQKAHANAPSAEALSALKIDFFKDRIFVFTPKGDVVDMPEGATPIDFAYHIHSEIGDHMSGAKVNGKMVSFSHPLKSGDAVEILAQKNKKPTPDWLDFTKTSLARQHIRAYLKKLGAPYSAKKERVKMEAVITVHDRVGMLKDLSEIFVELGINILDVRMDSKNKAYPKLLFYFHPKKGLNTAKILTAIKRVKNVEDATIKEVR
ncbi:MAG: GTP pyrophosphokinase [Candidatus Giovannonibacteria bacterium GW2011_GWC2_44_9]|uniref:GTP pyrophosphokinase n=2 Tax=Candidatus Giovannoniibacteriota TaxID=1752738 RepID=A0A0G1LBA9_9BACT|nr:MAG: GTP pyrophosphokinase [Candidatus Giovannonibacteria bacterium GW2011_GWB1_44_23]KKT83277.1 MAG: GTP pyrophosphokinase [Candidatus Giovannonibacteria bacterium GW2011_GWC2_44_9]